MAIRLSGLQREVLALYRKCLRESRKKPAVSIHQSTLQASLADFLEMTRPHFESFARSAISSLVPRAYFQTLLPFMLMLIDNRTEFRKSTGLDKKDFAAIEYLLRKGQRLLEMYSAPGIKDIR